MKRDYSNLQNGSDIRGVAMAGSSPVNLGAEEASRLSAAFGKWLAAKNRKSESSLKISIGHDSRITAESLKEAAIYGLSSLGIKVLDCGLASTPAMFMSTIFDEYRCDGAIMITASHLPKERNGFKYFSREGGLNKEDISEIIRFAETLSLAPEISETSGDSEISGASETSGTPETSGVSEMPEKSEEPEILEKSAQEQKADGKKADLVEKADLISTYSRHLREKIIKEVGSEKPLEGLKIVVDAGNGAGGFYALDILAPLGADISGSQFLEPDGTFPNHQPNPENPEAMASICKAVTENKADMGLIFDTDVDRSSAVDANGKEINRNAIVAMAAALIAKEHPGTTIVTDSITSDQLTDYIEKCLGLKHLRFKRGYRNVINKAKELNEKGIDSQLAIETSGHAAYKENYFLDDGAYLATKIVIKAAQLKKAGEGLDVILSSLEEPLESVEKRFSIDREDFTAYGQHVLDSMESWVKQEGEKFGAALVEPNYEGVRIAFDNEKVKGWCLLRKSLHDPKLPLNIEVTKGCCEDILKVISDFLDEFEIS